MYIVCGRHHSAAMAPGLYQLWLLIACSSAVFGVSFEHEFNELMDNELMSVEVGPGRVRRGVDPPNQYFHHWQHVKGPRHKMCCGVDSKVDEDAMNEKRQMYHTCWKALTQNATTSYRYHPVIDRYSCEKLTETRNHHYCIHECVMKKAGVITEEGKLDLQKAKLFQLKGIKDEWYKKVISVAVEKCAKQKALYQSNDKTDDAPCNPFPLNLKYCTWREITMTCPDEHWNEKNDFCVHLKEAYLERKEP